MYDDDNTASLTPAKRPLTACVMSVLDSGVTIYIYIILYLLVSQ